ncbi:MAG: D-alanyl-D-alanine carboxypeptidase/D-alanyl-D-alanine endopeptidase, partial [Plesiomonas shigelloides]
MRFLTSAAVAACVFSLPVAASVIPVTDYEQALPPGTQLSLLVQPTNGAQPLVAYQADKLVLPASTQKVFTALAAMLELGPDFRFPTKMGTAAQVRENKVWGDLVVSFSGDPRLTRDQIRLMANRLAQQNIKQVMGNLVIDTSVFGSHDKAPGWSW